jgi:hypothetical protein
LLATFPETHESDIPQAAGFTDGPQLVAQWPIRAREYNEVYRIAENLIKKIQEMELALEQAAKDTNKAKTAHEELEAYKASMEGVNRTTLPKDRILAHLDESAFNVAAKKVIFKEVALAPVPMSINLVHGDGTIIKFEEGEARREKVTTGIHQIETLLDRTADEILGLGGPLTEGH